MATKNATRQIALLCGEDGMITERSEPTLWPQSLKDDLKDEMRKKLALESLEKENKSLKELVVRLSETILRNAYRR